LYIIYTILLVSSSGHGVYLAVISDDSEDILRCCCWIDLHHACTKLVECRSIRQ